MACVFLGHGNWPRVASSVQTIVSLFRAKVPLNRFSLERPPKTTMWLPTAVAECPEDGGGHTTSWRRRPVGFSSASQANASAPDSSTVCNTQASSRKSLPAAPSLDPAVPSKPPKTITRSPGTATAVADARGVGAGPCKSTLVQARVSRFITCTSLHQCVPLKPPNTMSCLRTTASAGKCRPLGPGPDPLSSRQSRASVSKLNTSSSSRSPFQPPKMIMKCAYVVAAWAVRIHGISLPAAGVIVAQQ
mmetsp:Transcript_11738/g.45766  ORF Transcript_11738/g.45766 Transcript_11738/m.45766 type:complete len:247 (+) Transcript_11738:5163-5903(+)